MGALSAIQWPGAPEDTSARNQREATAERSFQIGSDEADQIFGQFRDDLLLGPCVHMKADVVFHDFPIKLLMLPRTAASSMS
jgi:hypothetical protein